MMTPVPASRKLLEKLKMQASDIDLWELNEAFSVQSLAVSQELGLDPARVNVNGGAVALGHPIGASGARILVTVLYALKHHNKELGVATLCMGGGNGLALAVRHACSSAVQFPARRRPAPDHRARAEPTAASRSRPKPPNTTAAASFPGRSSNAG